MSPEIWRTIPTHQDYEASSEGRIRNGETYKVLSGSTNKRNGRLYVNLGGKNYQVARLVARTFLGPCPPGKQVEHQDQDKTNNSADNLVYLTQSQNIRRSFKLSDRAKNTGQCLSERSYRIIKVLWTSGLYTQVAIAEMLGIDNSVVSRIVRGESQPRGTRELPKPTRTQLLQYRKAK